ncbi:MAG: hypothetical protein IKU55_02015 [Clostridia bacterium]|nr:hypothetical protein [Clostridia bacterium]
MPVTNSKPFRGSRWFKGNLHTHTQKSDGALSPRHALEYYRNHGYNFLAVTDHNLYDASELSDSDLLILPAGEFAVPNVAVDERSPIHPEDKFDIVFCGKRAESEKRLPAGYRFAAEGDAFAERLQNARALAEKTDNLMILAHPYGSGMYDCGPTDHLCFDAIEVYNHSAEVSSANGQNEEYWDYLLRKGHRVWGVASDDAHFYDEDGCGGWIMVSCDELTVESVTEAIAAGSFYATTGPRIEALYEENGEIVLKCSPCECVRFVQFEHRGRAVRAADHSDSVTEARFAYNPGAKYVRVECIRSDGKKAWSNPFYVFGDPIEDERLAQRTDPSKEAPAALYEGIEIRTSTGEFLHATRPLANGGKRLKGNLHTHTNYSDGETTPEETVAFYRAHDYQFLAITDHNRYMNTTEFDAPGFITLPGVELDIYCGSFEREAGEEARQYTYHLNGIAWNEDNLLPNGFRFDRPRWTSAWLTERSLRERVQDMIDFLNAKNNLVMFNHPNWSRNRETDVLGYNGLFGMEIYNHISEYHGGIGFSQHYYDFCLRQNQIFCCTATDDAHSLTPDAAGGGWVVVDSDSLSRASVGDALRRGCFYSSTGPEIYDWRLDADGYVRIECSPVHTIRIVRNGKVGRRTYDRDMLVSGARMAVKPGDVVYAEIIAPGNTYAWTNPIVVR